MGGGQNLRGCSSTQPPKISPWSEKRTLFADPSEALNFLPSNNDSSVKLDSKSKVCIWSLSFCGNLWLPSKFEKTKVTLTSTQPKRHLVNYKRSINDTKTNEFFVNSAFKCSSTLKWSLGFCSLFISRGYLRSLDRESSTTPGHNYCIIIRYLLKSSACGLDYLDVISSRKRR